MILVVDDHRDLAFAAVALLKCEGFQAEAVFGGDEAMAWLADRTPRLIILDDYMPGMTGIDILQQIKREDRLAAVPVIFHSAGAESGRSAEALALGAVAWCVKGPNSWTELTTYARQLLG